jgi:hypothetical protein
MFQRSSGSQVGAGLLLCLSWLAGRGLCPGQTLSSEAPAVPPAVQAALAQGQELLRQGQAGSAVAVLESQLACIDGSRAYLQTLRDAYITYITDLYLHNRQEEAQKYLGRLRILDPAAAQALASQRAAPASAVPARSSGPLGRSATTVRGVMAEEERPARLTADPFAWDHALPAEPASCALRVRQLLAQAHDEFLRRHYAAAQVLYAQAQALDKNLPAEHANEWAYCKLHQVVEELQKDHPNWAALEQQVREAQALSTQPRLRDFAQTLLQEVARRRGPAAATGADTPSAAPTRNGWQVLASSHFRLFYRQQRELAEQVLRVAEQTRQEMGRKWLGQGELVWQHVCDVYLYSTAAEYAQATGVPATSPGHCRIETDPVTGRVVSRQMYLHGDCPTLLRGVVPHETTHLVLAGQFGCRPLPRWADEGMAVLSEPAEQVSLYCLNLSRVARQQELFSVRELMELPDYPPAQRVPAFYAQSVCLVDFLSRQKGPQAFCQFLRDGLSSGFEAALRRHYGYRDYADLETHWREAVAGLLTTAPRLAER